MTLAAWGAEQWAAFGACAAVVVYVAIGLLAWWQVSEARRLRQLQTRPYVIVDFEFRRRAMYVVIRNIGTTPARAVTITFDQALCVSARRQHNPNEAAVFRAPIPMVAPGRALYIFLDSSIDYFKDASLPRRYVASVRYHGDDVKKTYLDPYVLDLTQYEQVSVDPPGVPELVAEVKKIREEMHKWTDGSRGLLALTLDRRRYMARTDRPYWREEAAHVRQQEGWVAYIRWVWQRKLAHHGWR